MCSCLKVTKFTDVWFVMFLISFTFVCPMVPETADADLLSDISCYCVISGNSTALSPRPHPRPNTVWVRADPLETKVAVIGGKLKLIYFIVSAYIRQSSWWNHVSLKVWFILNV